ncbi:MAG TPA: BON domain-containing protein, partial [Gammaproteobacteria bacterium]
IVHLTGNVESDIDRDLAAELAKGIEGVVEVDNDLEIAADARDAAAPSSSSDSDRSFGVWFDDATTTATVKSRLLANPNTGGLQIDVDTRGDVVTLTGEVGSEEEKALAEELARNTGDVKDVRNQLIVREMVAKETT